MTPFSLVLLPFPFTDLSANKQRPCLVLVNFRPFGLGRHSIVAMVTSQLTGLTFPGDTQISAWVAAGLPKSLVRLAKVVTVEESLIRKRLGQLQLADQMAIRVNFESLFAVMLGSRTGTRKLPGA
ncbi:MAG: type II toxin-antitoxin system PemK/MazF family toxin [Bryobacteraceae bacterium]